MKTANSFYGCCLGIAPALCIAVAAGSTQAGPPIDQDAAEQVNGKLPRERAVAVQPPVTRTPLAPAGVDREFLLFDAAVAEIDPAELTVRTIEVLDDATIARGRSRGLPIPQAPVYLQVDSCRRGHFFNDDYTHGLGTWFAQARFSCPPGFPFCLDNGWQPSGRIAGYEVSNFYCSVSSANDCSVTVELWDGDPLGIMDTVCNPAPAPIAGTKTTFSGLSRNERHNLRAHLPTPVTYNCDRVWIAVSMIEGCRGSWLLGGQPPTACWEDPADIGWGDGYGANWGCQAFGYCATPSEYNSGFCCTTGEACDYTDADPNNWTGDCQEGGAWPPECPEYCSDFFTHPTFCSDGVADYYFHEYGGASYGYYYAQPGAVYAASDKYIALLPVSADAPPDQNPTPDGWRISGNEIILEAAGRPVWLEIRISDLDPDDTGLTVKYWNAAIDASAYTGILNDAERPECHTHEDCVTAVSVGSVCEPPAECIEWGFRCSECYMPGVPCRCTPPHPLMPYMPPCTTDADCEVLLGPLGVGDYSGRGGCGLNGFLAGVCAAGFIDNLRTDYIFYGDTNLAAVLPDGVDYRYSSSKGGGPKPAPDGERYAGTLVLWVAPDAKGTFTISFNPLRNWVLTYYDDLIPLVGAVPAKITVETGSCCYQLGGADPPCLDNATRGECDALPGPRVFTPGGACADGCPEPGPCCLSDHTCEQIFLQQCTAQGGRAVYECLGDLDGDGRDDACLIEPVPTVSGWGLIIMALFLAVVAKVCYACRAAVSVDS